MAGNTFGHLFRLTTYGESHGVAIGGIIDGFPSGLKLDFEKIEREMQRRKPGQSAIVTQRKEEDKVEFLSGIFNGRSEEHTSELQSRGHLVCRLLLERKTKQT